MLGKALTSKEKAAILMIALGKEYSANVYKHLSDEEIEQLTLSITGLGSFDTDTKNAVLSEFYDICIAQRYVNEGGIEHAREILVKAMGAEKADELISKLSASLQVRPFDIIRKADPSQILNFIQHEHPQTIALILSYMQPQKAASVLSSLPEEIQPKVVQRIATMSVSSPEYIREAERILERKLSSVGQEENTNVGGISVIVDILNAIDRSTEKSILENIEMENPELADEIHRRMFIFEDITKLSNLALQRTLKEVDNDVLTMALKGASPEISAKIYSNISKRLQDLIKENMEYMGPVRVRDVEQAQQKIVNVIRKLEDEGEIEISRGGADEEFVV
jgi:flagellar motor switch protein FliG